MVTLIKVHIVRHGETEANKDGTIQGQLDTELNEEGLRQARLLAERMKSGPVHVAFTSDLQRAKKTAEIVLEHHPGVELQRRQELRERFMGTVQGTRFPPNVRKAIIQGDHTVETTEQLRNRVLSWWNNDIVPLAKSRLADHPEGTSPLITVLATSHGGSISTFFTAALSEGLIEFAPGVSVTRCWNTSVSTIEVDETLKGKVTMYADISHLWKAKVVQTNVDEVEVEESGPTQVVSVIGAN